jgi:hypothetical protein
MCYKGTNYYMEDAMSELSNEPVVPEGDQPMSMIDTWMAAMTKPNEGTFARIVAQPGATTSKAFLWVFVASLISTFASTIAQTANFATRMEMFRRFLPPEVARELPAGAAPTFGIGTVICGAPIGAVFAVLFFAIGVALVQWVAKLFGGTGSFDKLAYAFSAIYVPYSVVMAVLALLGIIPIVGILTGLLGIALFIYTIILGVLAVKAVDGLDTGKAVGAVLLPGVVIFLVVCCCAILVGVVVGASIGNVFDSINQSLGGF